MIRFHLWFLNQSAQMKPAINTRQSQKWLWACPGRTGRDLLWEILSILFNGRIILRRTAENRYR